MLHQASRPAFRRGSLLLAGAVVIAVVVTAVSLASADLLASLNATLHEAAHQPRFGAKSVAAAIVKSEIVVVKPRHAASTLLPVTNQDDIKPNHRILADQVLRALPGFCRQNLKNFYVNYAKNASNRGLGGEDTIIIIGNVPDNEFRALLTHECGHVADIGGLRGSPEAGQSGFFDGNTPIYQNDPSLAFYQISWINGSINQPGSKDADFVSGYAESDPFEDFAESFAFYALHKKEFQRLAKSNAILKAKYDFMDRVIFTGNPEIASSTFKRGSRVPWDVTKLPYVWHAKR